MKKKLIISELDEKRQAFVLALVHGNLMPEEVAKAHPWFSKTPRGGFDCLSGRGYHRLCELEEKGFKAAADEARAVTKAHWQGWAKKAVADLLAPSPTAATVRPGLYENDQGGRSEIDQPASA